jgi:hypothetical protein
VLTREISEGEGEPPTALVETVGSLVNAIGREDRRNEGTLERCKDDARRELHHLRSGRAALSAYRVRDEAIPDYVDRRS